MCRGLRREGEREGGRSNSREEHPALAAAWKKRKAEIGRKEIKRGGMKSER